MGNFAQHSRCHPNYLDIYAEAGSLFLLFFQTTSKEVLECTNPRKGHNLVYAANSVILEAKRGRPEKLLRCPFFAEVLRPFSLFF